jgi:hypothetical protein
MVMVRRGMMLMDVIIGSAMLAVGLAVVISMSSRSLARQSNAEHQVAASWLADETLAMVLVDGPDVFPKLNQTQGRFEPPFEAFSFQVDLSDEGEFLPVLATATVYWEAGGSTHSVAVETLVARRHGEPPPRAPAEPVDREARYWEIIESREVP